MRFHQVEVVTVTGSPQVAEEDSPRLMDAAVEFFVYDK